MQSKSKMVRNIIVFVVVAAAAGWVGVLLDAVVETPPGQGGTLGLLVFLVAPFTASLLLRAFGGDGWRDIGWKPNLRGNGLGYGIALLGQPALTAIVLSAGALTGQTTFAGLAPQGIGALLATVGMMFVADFFKNIFEEFAWRGYLTPRFQAAGLPDMLNHLLTGAVWATWHIPYWLFLLDRATYQDFTAVSIAVFLPLSILNIIASAILYGEVRLLTGSTIAAVVMHSASNAVILALLLEDFVVVNPAAEIWCTPGGVGIVGIVLVALAGLGLYQFRTSRRMPAGE